MLRCHISLYNDVEKNRERSTSHIRDNLYSNFKGKEKKKRKSRLDLSSNNFTGQLPISFGKLSNLSILNLENNKLDTEGHQASGLGFPNSLKELQFSISARAN